MDVNNIWEEYEALTSHNVQSLESVTLNKLDKQFEFIL